MFFYKEFFFLIKKIFLILLGADVVVVAFDMFVIASNAAAIPAPIKIAASIEKNIHNREHSQ